jgi:hypothetical protein|eukprot:COSAG02_NODE_2638_length_8353_cov_13.889145_5_plen_57_part_00
MVPVAVREHFLDENAQPARGEAGGVKKGELFPQVSSRPQQPKLSVTALLDSVLEKR